MNTAEECFALEKEAADSGIDMQEVLARAETHRATWDRWKAGTHEPQMRKWRKVRTALNDLKKEKNGAAVTAADIAERQSAPEAA